MKNAAGRAKRRRNEKKPRLECRERKKGGQDVWKMREMGGGWKVKGNGGRRGLLTLIKDQPLIRSSICFFFRLIYVVENFVSDYGKDISKISLQIFSLMFHVSHIDFANLYFVIL